MTIEAEIMTLVVRLQSAESWQQQYFEDEIRKKVDALVAERDHARQVAGYDWDLLEATQASLREHMQFIATLEAERDDAISERNEARRDERDAVDLRLKVEAENRALREAGKVLADHWNNKCGDCYQRPEDDAAEIFTRHPGAIEAWIAKGASNGS